MTVQLSASREALTALQRLHLRDALQDLWRDQVMRITELSVELHHSLDTVDAPGGRPSLSVPVASAIIDARLRLANIERAMRRLDDRSYGRCGGCAADIPFDTLILRPDALLCANCPDSSKLATVAPAAVD